jgi:sec-independent protein translocase protein TatA
MFNDLFGGGKILIVLVIVVLLFGATRLPALARSLGQSRNAFRAEMKKGEASAEASDKDSTEPSAPSDETTNTTPKP